MLLSDKQKAEESEKLIEEKEEEEGEAAKIEPNPSNNKHSHH